ncbi:Aste57867_23284 [Aphanomyces stellatus]|uniref:Aste57867_23284 protein n=1 Tax=Aphanomyces stellatus TaxID=120398 RepID=A0A485LMH1_9STRA|nr:hypothetical protein As57867_023213 [Aphanomyces stellatus]VFT99929.1 Aste57867_23284 [Aphanomyces stellatus]
MQSSPPPPAEFRLGPEVMNTMPPTLLLAKEPSRAIAIHPPSSSSSSTSPIRNQQQHAHSCPAPRHIQPHTAQQRRPLPHTPLIGSLPDPTSFFLNAPMPPLSLPPPHRPDDVDDSLGSLDDLASTTPRRETVVQFASSCPSHMGSGFLHHPQPAFSIRGGAFQPTDDGSDLSRSPSLALMRSLDTIRRERLSDATAAARLSLERLSLVERDEDKADNDDDDGAEEDDVFFFEAQ